MFVFGLVSAFPAVGSPISILVSGVHGSGNPLAGGSVDPHSTILGSATAFAGQGANVEAVEKGLRDHALRERIVENSAGMIGHQFEDWGAAADKIFRYLSQ